MDYIKEIRSLVGHRCIILNFAGGIIFDEYNRILLQRRQDKNLWGFLGGAIEVGESAEEAVIREVFEESGLIAQVVSLQGIYTKYFDSYPNGDEAQVITHFFRMRIIGGNLDSSNPESLELKFFQLNDIPKLVNQQHADALEDAKKGLFGIYR